MSAFVRQGAGLVILLLAAALAPAAIPSAAGDVKNGEAIYSRCAACHALAYDRTGPHHCGLFGRKAGTLKGFQYSDAMKHSGIVWTPPALDEFLANPFKAVPGTSMGYAGVTDAKERSDLIAYLQEANKSAECSKGLR